MELAEVGPRMEMKRKTSTSLYILRILILFAAYEIRQGTLEQNEAEREWVLAHYARTTKKRNVLSGPTPASEPPIKRVKR